MRSLCNLRKELNMSCEQITLFSSSILPLNTIASPMKILEGGVNLFLIKLENGKLGAHFFIMPFLSDESFIPVEKIIYNDEEYIYALIAYEDSVLCEDSAPNMPYLQKKWDDVFLLQFGKKITSDTNIYLEYIKENKVNIQKRANLKNDNVAMTALSLNRKIEELGKLASVSVVKKEQDTHEVDSFYLAMQEIAKIYHLPFEKNKDILLDIDVSGAERIENFCEHIGWRVRKVTLTRDFYKQNSVPIIVISKKTSSAVLVFPSSNNSQYIDFSDGNKKKSFTKSMAEDAQDVAYMIYELFPAGKLSKQKLLKFIFARAKNIWPVIAISALIASFLSLLSPLATSYITGKIIPTANLPELYQISIVLIVLLLCQIMLQAVSGIIMMTFNARQLERFQTAVYDHILRIPTASLKTCDVGDMTQRILGGTQIQATVFEVISQQFLSSIFALSNLAMMFYYSQSLASVGLFMVIVYAVLLFFLSKMNLKPLARQAEASGKVSGLTKQFIDGISKIRSAGAEQQVISRFMDDFSPMLKEGYKIATLSAYQSVFSSIFPLVISIIFYGMAGGFLKENLAFPIFLAFMAAFQNFQGGVLGIAGGIWTLLAIKPDVDRIMPILETEIEDGSEKYFPDILKGDIELSHIHFRYGLNEHLTLDDVSIHAKAGEFIAIVGSSGAGKSTLVRLLLGFEKCESGAIYYSGQDLAHLNLRAVRKQLGVILQNSKIISGSILENIIAGTTFTKNDALHALKLAAFDKDVEAMPMGIYTHVSPDNISGGQQQRILIARALIGNPVALIMDESTSALDSFTQQTIKKNIELLGMTRIVIAHRLSTIINADRIYVLDKGKVVEHGNYQELLDKNGIFKALALRQRVHS